MQSPSALDLALPDKAGGETPPDAAEGGGDDDEGDDEAVEDVPEEVLPRPSALKAVYARGGGENFLLAMGGWARGAIFECSWKVRIVAREPFRRRKAPRFVFEPVFPKKGRCRNYLTRLKQKDTGRLR